jgi:hypothetical protein
MTLRSLFQHSWADVVVVPFMFLYQCMDPPDWNASNGFRRINLVLMRIVNRN